MPSTFPHRHLLDIERLSKADIEAILALAAIYAAQNRKANKKSDLLHGKIVVNLFFENSTRTRTSFEIAAKRLGADVVNIPVEHSSTQKGETLLDTVLTLDAMQIDALVIRHAEDGVPQFLAPHVKAHVINAGDGKHEHPTQALLDALTIKKHKKQVAGVNDSPVRRCRAQPRGAVEHSFAEEIRRACPYRRARRISSRRTIEISASRFSTIWKKASNADVVMMLRVQHERMEGNYDFSVKAQEYIAVYGLNHDKLKAAKPDVIVMHPGPVNRGSRTDR